MAEGLKAKGISYVEITGDISEDVRDTYVERFNSTKEESVDSVDVILITAAGGEGTTLFNFGSNHDKRYRSSWSAKDCVFGM